jgi:hypothetical protein
MSERPIGPIGLGGGIRLRSATTSLGPKARCANARKN